MGHKILSQSFKLVIVFSSDGAGAVHGVISHQHTNTAVANDRTY
jgi:hypothetical protein